MKSLRDNFTALVVGASGGIGKAVTEALTHAPNVGTVLQLSRSEQPGFDIANEEAIAASMGSIKEQYGALDLLFDATGILEVDGTPPEKSFRHVDMETMMRSFQVNAMGPAFLLKHGMDLFSRDTKTVFATLSARVGSIGDNKLGGWISYRASKAALNQIVRAGSIELSRKRPQSVCVALHPGTIDTDLTRAYARGRITHTPAESAQNMLGVLDGLKPEQTGRFFAYNGEEIPW